MTNSSILPIAIKIAAKTISNIDYDKVMEKILYENRKRKLNYILHDQEYIEYKIEDTEEYKSSFIKVEPLPQPKGLLFYIDYKYK